MGELLAGTGHLRMAGVPAAGGTAGGSRGQLARGNPLDRPLRRLQGRRLRRAVGCGRPDVRAVDALPRGGARAVDRPGHLRRVRHPLPRHLRGRKPLCGQRADPAAGRLDYVGGHRRDRLRRVAALAEHDRRGETRRRQGLRPYEGAGRGVAGGRDERLLQPRAGGRGRSRAAAPCSARCPPR